MSAVYLNLSRELVRPAAAAVTTHTPTPLDTRTPRPLYQPIEPTIGYAAVIAEAQREAQRRGWTEPAGGASYNPRYGIYQVRFFQPGDDMRLDSASTEVTVYLASPLHAW